MKDKIIEKLSNESKGLSLIEINDLLNLTSVEDYKELQKNMDALVTEGIVHKSKKDKFILMEKCSSLLTGIIHINKHGNGFVDTLVLLSVMATEIMIGIIIAVSVMKG